MAMMIAAPMIPMALEGLSRIESNATSKYAPIKKTTLII